MRNKLLRGIVFLLSISMLIGLVPVMSLAAGDELVLSKIGHTSTNTISINDAAIRSVNLTVPFGYVGATVDLADGGLSLEKAPGITTVIPTFESGSTATVGDPGTPGPAVTMTLMYYKGTDTTTQYTALYSISIERAAKVEPVFTGTITKSFTGVLPNTAVNDITFSLNDFSNLYRANDGGPITAVSISGTSLACGILKIAASGTYNAYISGDKIDLSQAGNLVFDAENGGSASYLVSAYAGTDTAIGSVLLNIDIKNITAPTLNAVNTVSKSVNINGSAAFTVTDFSSLCSLNNGTLSSIEITPTNTGFGTWYNGSSSFTTPTVFSAATISNLKFTGTAAGTAMFNWRISNEAGYSLPGTGTVTVNPTSAPIITSAVTKSVSVGATVTFNLSDFSSHYNLNNGTFNNIIITPANSTYGTWYKGASVFTTATAFTASEISTLQFKGTLAGSAAFTWTVSNTEKGASAPGSGSITVQASSTTIAYTTPANTPKTFVVSYFNTACRNATGGTLSYVSFSSLSTAYGILYYGYSSASNPGSPVIAGSQVSAANLSGVTFVPASGYTGMVSITYTGVTTGGVPYTGTIRITVGNTTDVTYTTVINTPKTFSASGFTSACTAATNGTLSYIYLTPPSTSYGRLYYGYISSLSPGTAITSSTQITASNISAVTFVPASNYTGTCTIAYTGYTTGGTSFTGNIKITVSGTADVTYTTAVNTPKTFAASDFTTACSALTNGGTLSYVYFSIPSSSYGTLYYNYSSPSYPGTAITSSNQITASYISVITFVPAANYTGTFTITYTGYTTSGTSFTGYIRITVGGTSDVTYTTAVNTPKTFSAANFSTACSAATNGGSLSYVYFSIPSLSYGSLYYGYVSASNPGTVITSSTQIASYSLSSVTFVPAYNYTGTVTITYTGYTTSGASYTGSVKITVGTAADVTYSTAVNTPKTFVLSDFNTACSAATGGTLSSVYFTPPSSSYGKLNYGYTSSSNPGVTISSSDQITASYISAITFIPATNYTGTVTIDYTGYSTGGATYTGHVIITVGGTSDVTYTTAKNTPKTFSAANFNTACSAATNGGTLSYVYFTIPSSSYGVLYYGYSSATNPGTAITSSTQIAASYLSSVTFVPAANYTGSFSISYTGYTTTGASFTGYVKITVGGTTDVTYTTAVNTPKTFSAADFNTACSAATNGGTLSYIYFTIPSSSYGVLYYGYSSATNPGTAVTSSTKISASYLSYVTFVPAANYTGSFSISYTGYTTGGTAFSGSVKMTVGNSGNVTYTTTKNTAKTFVASDFNTACSNATGLNLSYIVLTPPSSTYGKLYRNYSSSANPGTALTAATTLYYSGTPGISTVTFVPATSFTGTATLSYTGYTTSGTSYQGSVIIKVTGTAGDVSYTVVNTKTLKFISDDLNSVCYNATGAELNYVYFTLPSSTYGKLYYNYTSTSSAGTAVSASTAYYADYTPYIDYVTFVPASGYIGTVTVSYTGYNVNGTTFSGKINIQVKKSSGSSYFTDVGEAYDWAAGAIDYLYNAGVIKGTGGTTYTPGANMTRGDFMLMLYRAMSFKGSTSSNFSDVPKGSYYYEAIAAAKALGIAKGDNNKFYPNSPLTRQDAMVLIYRALLLTGKTLVTGTASDLSGFSDAASIAGYAQTAVATLVKAGMVKGAYGKMNPLGTMTRAEMAVVLYRVKITY